jgi:ubiquinol-cytochrome c reductase cytochrome c subunit
MTKIEDRLMATARKASLLLTLVAATAFGCAHEGGAGAPAAPVNATDAVAQAEAGGPLYGQFCAKCHGDAGQGTDQGPPVVGTGALPLDPRPTAQYRKTQFRTARDVFDFVGANMPPKGPKPTLDQYLAILAFDLKANGVDLSGKPPLTPDALSAIVIHP